MSKRKPKGANHPTIPPKLPQDVNSGWNAAVEYIAASFDKRSENHQFGACSYSAAAAIVRTYRHDPVLPEHALAAIEADIRELRERHDALLEYIMGQLNVDHENRPELRMELGFFAPYAPEQTTEDNDEQT